MVVQLRIRDYGINIGNLDTGKRNSITDVPGVKVGHETIRTNSVNTGVTAILPHEGNVFREKVIAASYVINGFGKTTGLIQINELGTIETPIILTNTLSVGAAYDALVEYMLLKNEDIGVKTGTVNPVICECNDGFLNEIRGRHIEKTHIFSAIENASDEFEEGDIGAGTGMSCFQLKGGIGTSSRIISLSEKRFTLGVLVLSNFGSLENLIVDGFKAGRYISENVISEKDKGSIITVIATNAPMSERQLNRLAKRAVVGINRTGSFLGSGSGDIVIAFSTFNRINHYEGKESFSIEVMNEDSMDTFFKGVAEATEEAILNSLICSSTTVGRDGNKRSSLKEYISDIMNKKNS